MSDPRARYERLKRKGDILERPDCPRHTQIRPAFLGWQWRISISGDLFSHWHYAFGLRGQVERVVAPFDPAKVEVLP